MRLKAFIVAGEESGDALGAALMRAVARQVGQGIDFIGIGGERMIGAGLKPLFPMGELGLHGISAVVRRLPQLIGRLKETAAAVVAERPDVLIVVDSPSFNLRLAKRVKRRNSAIPVVDYVSPSVWAHNAWRARRMAAYVDEILAILPFEPQVHRELGGPPCVYVGHPLVERLHALRPELHERLPVAEALPPTLLVLPGSRRTEVRRLMAPFGEAVAKIAAVVRGVEVVLPAVAHLKDEIESRLAGWAVQPTVVSGEEAKFAAFRRAHAALAASGTVTLELALSGVPMAVAYRIEPLLRPFKPLLRAQSIVLANLVLGENVIPELIDRDSTPAKLAEAVIPLLRDTPERARQVAAFRRLDEVMMPAAGKPADLAAAAVLGMLRRARPDLAAGLPAAALA